MFKKGVVKALQNPLGGKETKKLRADIRKRLDISEALLDTFFGVKDNIQTAKLTEPVANGAPVSKFVVKGSDLMLPGVAFGVDGGPFATPEDMPEFQEGSGMLVFCVGNPMPIAVGEMLVSKKDAIASGMKGKGCKIVHCYRDSLWESGSGFAPPGFLSAPDESGAWVEALPGGGFPDSGAGVVPAPGVEGAGGTEGVGGMDEGGSADAGASADGMSAALPDLRVSEAEAPPVEETGGGGSGGGGGGGGGSQWEGQTPDEMAVKMLLSAIKTRVLPEGLKLDFKSTSYKKLSKFFSTMEKKKLVKCKTVFGLDSIEKVFREHADVVAYQAEERGGGDAGAAAAGGAGGRPSFVQGLRMVTERNRGGWAEAISIYCKANFLVEEDKFKVDSLMLANLYVKFKEEERPALGDLLSRKTLVRKGTPQKVTVTVEDRQGGRKAATFVHNLEDFSVSPESFCKQVQKKLNTSANFSPLPGKNETRVEVTMQGNLLYEVGALLTKEFKVPPDFISLIDKTKKK
ncbi:hypothetical protein T484DRAFT_1844063 [Baffinella frigidus]|nr:hypothetical protein T484DRAFT_1844063 [Cryptophyta sp. CCMP2293]